MIIPIWLMVLIPIGIISGSIAWTKFQTWWFFNPKNERQNLRDGKQ